MTITTLRRPEGLARASTRELVWGLRKVSREVAGWRAHAARIPDPELRADALRALRRKRGNINGAALFWTLPDRRNRDLLRALVAYEVLADYLDCVSERGASRGVENGRQLHLALIEALDPESEISDYYRHHQSRADGGYARALVESCRCSAARLPSYAQVRPLLQAAGAMSPVLGLNHEPDPIRREQALREWAGERWPGYPAEHTWFERTAAASAWLTVLALLALAAEPTRKQLAKTQAQQTYATYLHWIAPAGAMLDSYSDIAEDSTNGDHSYISHYPSRQEAVQRIAALTRRARQEAKALPGGARHEVLTASMIAFYLSKASVRAPTLRSDTQTLKQAGGPMVALLLPIMRAWRAAYGQSAA